MKGFEALKLLILCFSLFLTFIQSAMAEDKCDKYTANPSDTLLTLIGVNYESINSKLGIKYCTEAINKNPENYRYLYQLGRAYYKEDKKEQAFKYIKMAADKKYPIAFSALAHFYENGIIVEKDIEKAKQLYTESFELGHYFAYASIVRLSNQNNYIDFNELWEKQGCDGDLTNKQKGLFLADYKGKRTLFESTVWDIDVGKGFINISGNMKISNKKKELFKQIKEKDRYSFDCRYVSYCEDKFLKDGDLVVDDCYISYRLVRETDK